MQEGESTYATVDVMSADVPEPQGSGSKKMAGIIILIIILAAFGGAWQFYLKDQFNGDDGDGDGNGNGNGSNQTQDDGVVAAISITDEDGDGVFRVGENLTFNGGSSKPVGKVSYVWDLGDGTKDETNTSTLIHNYSKTGTFTVKLTVGHQGDTNTTTQNIEVKPEEPPAGTITVVPGRDSQNLMCKVEFQISADASQSNYMDYLLLIYNISASNETTYKFTDTLDSIEATPSTNPQYVFEDGVYVNDRTPAGEVQASPPDEVLIAGDGGYDLAPGDYVQIMYAPDGIDIDTAQLQSPLPI